MKGGVGKTTATAHIFRVLYFRKQKNVLLIDLDAQYNLTQSIMLPDDYDVLVAASKTVLSCFEPPPSNDFFKVKKAVQPPPPASQLTRNLKHLLGAKPARLDVIAGDFKLIKYSLIDDHKQLEVAADYFRRFIAAAKLEYDLIVLDCNPSSSFITKCALEVSSHVLSPVRPDKYSVLGIKLVSRLIDHLDFKLDQIILMNGTKRGAGPDSVETELRADPVFGSRVLVNRLPFTKLLFADQSYTGFATDKKVSWSETLRVEIRNIVDELSVRLGL